MNRHAIIFVLAVIGLTTVADRVTAMPRGGSNLAYDYLARESDKTGWSCGVFYQTRDRVIQVGNSGGVELDQQRFVAHVGYSPIRWLTVHGMAGQNEADFATGGDDSGFIYGLSLEADLFTHEIQDPGLMENEIRLNAGAGVLSSQAEYLGTDYDIVEVELSATVSIVNHVTGSKQFLPESIALFVGPAYLDVSGDDINDNDDDAVGLIAGLEVFQTKRVSYHLRVENFEKSGAMAGVNVRF